MLLSGTVISKHGNLPMEQLQNLKVKLILKLYHKNQKMDTRSSNALGGGNGGNGNNNFLQ